MNDAFDKALSEKGFDIMSVSDALCVLPIIPVIDDKVQMKTC